jgi:hypothetical protein
MSDVGDDDSGDDDVGNDALVPKTNAFDVMAKARADEAAMRHAVETMQVIGIIYQFRLLDVPNDDPLYGVSYIGQSVRSACFMSAENVFEDRTCKHKIEANRKKNKPNDVGFHAAINKYGFGAFQGRIVESKVGQRKDVAKWADEYERLLIKQQGY